MKMQYGWAFPEADEFMVAQLAPDGTYQGAFLQAALAYVTEWTVAIDGGAHAGTWSRTLAQKFDRVLAFEPAPDTFAALEANMAAFGCLNVTRHQAALGASAGTVDIAPLDERAASLKNTGARYVTEGGPIPRVAIDTLGLATLGFLKLDIEGAEVDALLGAGATLRRCRPIVHFENKGFWRRFGYAKEAPQVYLTQMKYRPLEHIGTDSIWGPT